MISPKTDCHRASIFSRTGLQRWSLLGLAVGLTALTIAGCKEEPPPPPPVVRTPPPPPPPDPKPDELLTQVLPTDSRVRADNTMVLNATEEDVVAALRFADAFARGSTTDLERMLDSESVRVLRDLDSEQVWSEQADRINTVTLLSVNGGQSEDGVRVGMLFSLADGDSVTLTWSGRKRGDMHIFEPYVVVPAIRDPLANDDAADGDEAEGDNAGGGSRANPAPGNPRDPRRRIPREDPRTPPQDPGRGN